MVKHIVMFKLKEKSPENMERVVSTLRGLDGEIETLRFLEVGVDFKKSERSYDIVLTTYFDHQEGLAAYTVYLSHLPAIDTMRKLCSSSFVVDYITESSGLTRDSS